MISVVGDIKLELDAVNYSSSVILSKGDQVITGWRGKIGRMLPDSIYRHMLNGSLGEPVFERRTISDFRSIHDETTLEIAANLKISVIEDLNSSGNCVQINDWARLRQEFERRGLVLAKITGQQGYSVVETWSVREPVDKELSFFKMDLRGLGSVWNVYAGELTPVWDAQDFVGGIDAVYTWVDSSDEEWFADYQASLHKLDVPYRESVAGLGRFKSRDELLFSLRSLELNLPWIDHVYLVTAGQVPKWLNIEHPRLTVVAHEEIFDDPEEALPTFNSHAIEANLSNIPGLKEHFIYINDDVFFGRRMHPNDFYGPVGQAKFALSNRHFALEKDAQLPVNQAARNNREIMLKNFERTVSRKFKHVAHPQRKSVHQYIKENYPEDIGRISREKFRGKLDLSIPSSLAHQIAARLGLGYSTTVDYQYLEIGSEDFYLDALRFVRAKQPSMFCINEILTSEDSETRDDIVRGMLQSLFPLKSSFESVR